MKKRVISIIAVIVIFATTIVGCANNSNDKNAVNYSYSAMSNTSRIGFESEDSFASFLKWAKDTDKFLDNLYEEERDNYIPLINWIKNTQTLPSLNTSLNTRCRFYDIIYGGVSTTEKIMINISYSTFKGDYPQTPTGEDIYLSISCIPLTQDELNQGIEFAKNYFEHIYEDIDLPYEQNIAIGESPFGPCIYITSDKLSPSIAFISSGYMVNIGVQTDLQQNREWKPEYFNYINFELIPINGSQ